MTSCHFPDLWVHNISTFAFRRIDTVKDYAGALHVTTSMLERKFWNSGYPEKGLEGRCWKCTPHYPGGLLAMHVGYCWRRVSSLA